jgi:septum site-determining protein MinD
MGRVVVVTSGKGGVGKTTSTAALGAALARGGRRVAVVDFDVGLRNLDLVMGAERRVVFDLTNVVQGTARLAQALLPDPRLDTLYLLPASQIRGKEALTEDGVARVIGELRDQFEWVICDSPAGIERGAILAMRFADEAILIVNPEISSVRDSSRILAFVDSRPLKVENGGRLDRHLLITRFDPQRVSCGEMLSIDDIRVILPVPLLGIIPESEEVLRASNLGAPLTVCARESDISRAYVEAARRMSGERVDITVPGKKGLFTKLLGGRAA